MSNRRPAGWWRDLTEDDPITLEPICSLPCPPFELSHIGKVHYFDAPVLAEYIISQGVFENPLNRSPLTRDDCRKLDEHLSKFGMGGQSGGVTTCTKVTDAYDLQASIKVGKEKRPNSDSSQRALQLRRQAAVALQGLFNFRLRSSRQRQLAEEKRKEQQTTTTSNPKASSQGFFDEPDSAGWGRPSGVHDMDAPAEAKQEEEDAAEVFPELSEAATLIAAARAKALEEKGEQQFAQLQSLSAAAREEERARAREAALHLQALRRELAAEEARQTEERSQQLRQQAALAQQRRADTRKVKDLMEAREQQEQQRQWTQAEAEAATAAKAELPLPTIANEALSAVLDASEDEEEGVDLPEGLSAAERKKAKKQRQKKNKKERERAAAATKKAQLEAEAKQKQLEAQRAVAAVKCDQCGKGVLGRGFERLCYRYCSMNCLHAHRTVLESKG